LVYIKTVMVRLGSAHSNRTLLAWYIIPACLFLIALGMRLPDLARLHSSPKPTPRAVVESASKAGKSVVVKQVVAAVFFSSPNELPERELFPLRFRTVSYQVESSVPPQISARAPPV
jgi:hypothetical protein